MWRGGSAPRTATVMTVAGVLGRLRKPHQVIAQSPVGGFELGPKVVLFVHWDRGGRVRKELFAYIAQLRDAGRSVVFVTNAGELEPTAEERLVALCAGILIRRNIGYDFGAWRDAIETLDLPRAGTEEIIIANDSVLGPFRPLEATLLRLDYGEADVWGLTDSWQRRYPLQSYFGAFGPRAIRVPAFRKFWADVKPAPSKTFIIRKYEIGLTQAMLQAGIRISAVWPYEILITQAMQDLPAGYLETDADEDIDPRQLARWRHVQRLRRSLARRAPLNPTSDLWRYLLLSGFPFIKRELLNKNPTRVEDVGDWPMVLWDDCGVDLGKGAAELDADAASHDTLPSPDTASTDDTISRI